MSDRYAKFSCALEAFLKAVLQNDEDLRYVTELISKMNEIHAGNQDKVDIIETICANGLPMLNRDERVFLLDIQRVLEEKLTVNIGETETEFADDVAPFKQNPPLQDDMIGHEKISGMHKLRRNWILDEEDKDE